MWMEQKGMAHEGEGCGGGYVQWLKLHGLVAYGCTHSEGLNPNGIIQPAKPQQ